MSRPLLTPLFGFLGLFAGCSGGSSAVGPPPLLVTSQSPPPGSIVDVDAMVTLVFGTDPEPASLTGTAMTVHDGSGPLPGVLAYQASARALTWSPTRELPLGALLTVRVADSVLGLAGERLPIGYAWSFRVRAGVPAPPVQLASSVVTSSDDSVFVALYAGGQAQVAVDTQSWRFDAAGVGPTETLFGGRVRGLHIDAAGNAVAMTVAGTGGGAPVNLTRRSIAGTWSPAETITNTMSGALVRSRLVGNEAGDLMAHLNISLTSPARVVDRIHWAAGGAAAWQALTLPPPFVWYGLFATLDGAGRVATLHRDGEFVIVERQDPGAGTARRDTVAQGSFVRAGGLGASVDGRLRAIWHEPGNVAVQRRAAPGAAFGPRSNVPVFVPTGSLWAPAPTGAIVGWSNTRAFRSEAGSDDWASATLPTEPLAVAMSPRGEAVFLSFQLPDSWFVVRWRAGEPIDPPLRIAAVPSPFAGLREGAVAVDAIGRVVAAITPEAAGELIGIRIE